MFLIALLLCISNSTLANMPGGGNGKGPNVTVIDRGDTAVLSNGIVSITIEKKAARLNSIAYTYNNGTGTQTSETLAGNRQYYYGGFSLGSGTFEYSLATDPAKNGGEYADITLMSVSETNGIMEVHFSMLRGSQGFYSTAMMTHRAQDERFEVGAWGVVTRVPKYFNWLSADKRRNFFIGVPTTKGVRVPDAPHEITVNLDGTEAGNYADKFIYGQDHADLRAWGWSSVGEGGLNIGRWIMTTMEFSNGGPLKRDVSVYPYSCLNNSILTGEVGQGSDGYMDKGEIWTKTCGPWFMYVNHVPASIKDAKTAAHALYDDALAQAEAERAAWPYKWFKHKLFVPPTQRGSVTGKLVIKDPGNPNASAAKTWVGLQIQPQTYKGFYDFQKWSKTYQFWVQTEADGSFTIPHVIPGNNYNLWAFGPGTPGTFLSKELDGGQPPYEHNIPAKPFLVEVKPAGTTELGTITWTPVRVGETVFELGIPNRKADEFRHGEDYWYPGVPPKLGFPTPIWGGQMEFPHDFPDGLHYTVGKSEWPTDWNYVLPAMADTNGKYQPCSGTIAFTLDKAPDAGAKASLYLALAGNDSKEILIKINDTDLGTTEGVIGVPNSIGPKGFSAAYEDTSSIHFSDHGPFCDERISFPSTLLKAGENTITITMNTTKLSAFLMVDYLRLELTGYVPPAPDGVVAFAGNGRTLVVWSPVPGALSYTVLRSTSPDDGFAPIATDFIGPVCGSGAGMVMFTDQKAQNGTEYFYAVQSVNSKGNSTASKASAAVRPSAQRGSSVPAAAQGVKIVGSGHREVALEWGVVPEADFYTVFRTTLISDGVGGKIPIGERLLTTTRRANFTDASPTDGRTYSYYVKATNASGTSPASTSTQPVVPLPKVPATAPQELVGAWTKTRNGHAIKLSWSPVAGATGYVIYRTIGSDVSFDWPADFLTALLETTYTDQGNTDRRAKVQGLDADTEYGYRITAVNAAGISPSTTVRITPVPANKSKN